jgi:glucose/arabinose dehydrogenase
MARRFAAILFLEGFLVSSLLAGTLPATPVLIEPERDGQVVSAVDVHMVTAAFSDADGNAHRCTDWQIREGDDVLWEAPCASGAERIHIHLGDGAFAGGRELADGTTYRVFARHRDDSGDAASEWSDWGEREFRTSVRPVSPPLSIRDAQGSPEWTLTPPPGAALRVEAPDGALFFEVDRGGARDGVALHSRAALRVLLTAGATEWAMPESDLAFDDENGRRRILYLPAVVVEAGGHRELWVSQNGGTHLAETASRAPDFTKILRGAPVPWISRQPGFVIEKVAGDLQLPLQIAFVPLPEEGPDAVLYYVVELYGAVKAVTRSGHVHDFAENLLDIEPTGHFPGNGEWGLGGITVDPENGDVYVTGVYWPDRTIWSLHPRVLRLRPTADGLRAAAVETVVAFTNEQQSPSHQISNITFGPDGKLYVHAGDGAEHENGQKMTTIRGKILRMNRDGTPPADNPFFDDRDGISATDYIYALGLRNPFGGSWRAADQSLYCIENGPLTDRFARIVAGQNYLWDGTDASMSNFALRTWQSPAAPVQVAFMQPETFGGSGFPREKWDSAFVTESGPTWASGVQTAGKRITEVSFRGGQDVASAAPLIEYDGTGRATVAGIAAGPDGLYFTDLYRDYGFVKTIDRGAQIFRVRWAGHAAFSAQMLSSDGRFFAFTDRSAVDGATSWHWEFGDGTTSSERSPRHVYGQAGLYFVRLFVTGAAGTRTQTKKIWAGVAEEGLTAEYFGDTTFGALVTRRSESRVAVSGAPDPAVPADGFSARWTGALRPRVSESHRFSARTSEDVRVRVGGVLVIDQWDGAQKNEPIDLEAGHEVPLVIEYRHRQGRAALEVLWESDSQPLLHVPRTESPVRRRSVRP